MGYSRVDCRAGVFALLALFLVPTLWGTLLCPLPCYGTDNQRHENHLYVDCPGVGQVARGLRTESSFPSHDYPEYETPSKKYENGPIAYFEVITGF